MNVMNVFSGCWRFSEKKAVFFLEWVRLGLFYVHFASLGS